MLKELYYKHQLFFLILGVLAVGFLIWYFSPIVICVLIAGVVMIIGQPLVERLKRIRIGKLKIPNGLSVTLTLGLIVVVFLGIMAFIVPLIVKEVNMLTSINPEQFVSYFQHEIDQFQAFLINYGIMAQDETIAGYLKSSLLKVMNTDLVSNILNNIFTVAGNIFFYFFTTLFLAFFFLLDREMLKNFILVLFPVKYEDKARNILSSSKKLLSRYFIGLIAEMLALSLLVSFGLMLIGVGGAFPIGFFAGIMNIIPYIGYAIATILGIILGVTGVVSTGAYAAIGPIAIKVLVVFVVANMIDNTFFQPFFFGKSVKASPVEIFLVIIASGFIGGVLGMIVAVPAYTFIRIVAREFFSEFRVVRKLTDNI
jgi:predicted PurR-regulated permease PerM